MSTPQLNSESRLIPAKEVMARLGYKKRQSFWDFVRRSRAPHIRLSSRRVVFDEETLNRWLASRLVGKVPANPSLN